MWAGRWMWRKWGWEKLKSCKAADLGEDPLWALSNYKCFNLELIGEILINGTSRKEDLVSLEGTWNWKIWQAVKIETQGEQRFHSAYENSQNSCFLRNLDLFLSSPTPPVLFNFNFLTDTSSVRGWQWADSDYIILHVRQTPLGLTS